MLKSYKYRLLPTAEQAATLDRWMGMCRFVYNLALETRKAVWSSGRISISDFDLIKQLTVLKNTDAKWLQECPAQSLQTTILNLGKAHKRFFKGAGYPKFKKKSSQQSIHFPQDVIVTENKARIPKISPIGFIQHRQIGDGAIKTVTISKTKTNKYFISFLIDNGIPIPQKSDCKVITAVGIDVGLKHFVTLSNGNKIENPRYLRSKLFQLRLEQRTLARRYKRGVKSSCQSNRYHKQRMRVALLYEKIANQRRDFLHKMSTAITKQYDTICLENLNISGMLKTNMASAISDASWHEFMRQLQYKGNWHGINILYIDRFAPSSRTCSDCGFVFNGLKLSNRDWRCVSCGTHHDRDINAAKNIKNFGLRARPTIANASNYTTR